MRAIPTSRVYQHKRCGDQTVVSGNDFEALSNPFTFSTGTMCASCGKAYSLKEFIWADSGETIAGRRRRLRAAAPASQKLFGYLLGPALFGLIGGVIGQLIKPGNFPAIAGGVGGGFALFTFLLLAPLTRLLFNIDYRQVK